MLTHFPLRVAVRPQHVHRFSKTQLDSFVSRARRKFWLNNFPALIFLLGHRGRSGQQLFFGTMNGTRPVYAKGVQQFEFMLIDALDLVFFVYVLIFCLPCTTQTNAEHWPRRAVTSARCWRTPWRPCRTDLSFTSNTHTHRHTRCSMCRFHWTLTPIMFLLFLAMSLKSINLKPKWNLLDLVAAKQILDISLKMVIKFLAASVLENLDITVMTLTQSCPEASEIILWLLLFSLLPYKHPNIVPQHDLPWGHTLPLQCSTFPQEALCNVNSLEFWI